MKSIRLAFVIGMILPALIGAARYIIGIVKWWPRYDRWARASQGRCPNCGYDLTANVSGTCPECGTKREEAVEDPGVVTHAFRRGVSQPRWVWAVTVAAILIAVTLQRMFWP